MCRVHSVPLYNHSGAISPYSTLYCATGYCINVHPCVAFTAFLCPRPQQFIDRFQFFKLVLWESISVTTQRGKPESVCFHLLPMQRFDQLMQIWCPRHHVWCWCQSWSRNRTRCSKADYKALHWCTVWKFWELDSPPEFKCLPGANQIDGGTRVQNEQTMCQALMLSLASCSKRFSYATTTACQMAQHLWRGYTHVIDRLPNNMWFSSMD